MFRRGFLSIFSIFLIGSLFGVIRVAEVEASETIYIRADGSIDPPTANITSADNVTYTFIGNINESIVVERNNIVVDGAGYTLQGSGSGIGFNCSSINNVTIQNTNIKEFLQGIWLHDSSNYNSISGNNITNNEYGIFFDSSNYNSISGNTLTDNRYGIMFRFQDSSNYNGISGNNITNNRIGIGLVASSNNTIQENHITANAAYGIRLSTSSNNTIQENHITANVVYGIWLSASSNNTIQENTFIDDGFYVTDSYQNSVENNTVNGKPLVYLEGVSNHTVDDAGQVILVRCENIRVEGLNLSRTSVGVELWETSNSTISGNNITANNEYGIYSDSSNYNSISGNNITANNWRGVSLEHSSNSSVSGNNIANNHHGVSLEHSSNNNSIQGNHITANNNGGIWLDDFSNYNSISGNNITDNEYGIGISAVSNYNSISGNNITANNLLGIGLQHSSNSSVSGNHIANHHYGIMLSAVSNYNSISGNLFTNDGLYVGGSYQNSVENNTVNGKPLVYLEGVSNHTVDDDAGQVILVRCENIRVEGLNLSRTCVGVELWETSNSTISGNHITNNWLGIMLYHSSNGSIIGNSITANNEGGIGLYYSSSNRIFHNNLINNTNQVYSDNSVNIWDDGYPSGGNYWSNYSGVDLDPDGIGDSQHVIDANNTDHYPLMGMFTNFNATSEHYVQTICNSTISEFQHNGTAISFNVTGENGSAGFCRICVPTALMSDYRILVNGTEVDYNLLPVSNSTHSYLYFIYEHSTKEVTIIPEFPLPFVISGSMIVTLLVAILMKKGTLPD